MIHISRSVVGAAELEAMGRVIREDGYLGMGQEVRAFEAELQEYLGGRDRTVICLNSGTAALHLAVQALTSPGDEVLVQSLALWPRSRPSGRGRGAGGLRRLPGHGNPGPGGCRPENYAPHQGRDADPLRQQPRRPRSHHSFAERHGLRVIEDAAHAFGCTYKGRKIGSFGDLACFSFDGLKNITSGEGGAVVTSDPGVIQAVQDARLLGVQRDTEKRYQGARSWEFDVQHQGYRYHMSNLFAAVGRVQLGRFEGEFKPRRIALAQKYRTAFAGAGGIFLFHGEPGPIVPHIFPIRVLNGKRDGLRQFLRQQGIESGIHYKPNHLLSFLRRRPGIPAGDETLYDELVNPAPASRINRCGC